MMKVLVEMWAFENGKIRVVNIPDERIRENIPRIELLDLVYCYGQNAFQPLPMCSVSVGDVVLLHGDRFLCDFQGWTKFNHEGYKEHVKLAKEQFALAAK